MIAALIVVYAASQQAQAATVTVDITVNPGPVGTEFRSLPSVNRRNDVVAALGGEAGLYNGQRNVIDFMFTNPVSVGRGAAFDWSLFIQYDRDGRALEQKGVSLLDSNGEVIRDADETRVDVSSFNSHITQRGTFLEQLSGPDQIIFSGVRFDFITPNDRRLAPAMIIRLGSSNTSPDPSVNPLSGPFTVVSADPAVIPVPAAAPLFMGGLAGFGFLTRIRKKRRVHAARG